jgi:hypothetical protein
MAKRVEKKTISKIKLNDIKGNGILDCYRKYINLIGEIEIANNNNNLWKTLTEFKTVRNSITHHYGRIDKKLDIFKRYDLYFGPSETQIRLRNVNFLKDFCEISINYMTMISDEMNEKDYSS